MLNFMLKNNGQKMNSVASVLWIIAVLGTEICGLVTLLISVATGNVMTAMIGGSVTVALWVFSFLPAMYYQCMVDVEGGVKGTPAVEDAGKRMKAGAKLVLLLLAILAVLGVVVAVLLTILTGRLSSFLCVLLALAGTLFTGWFTALWMQCMGEMAEGAEKFRWELFRALLGNAAGKMQFMASLTLVLGLAAGVVAIIGGVVTTVIGVPGWRLVLAGLMAIAMGWAGGVYMQAVGNAVAHQEHVCFAPFGLLLGHASGKVRALMVIGLTVMLADAIAVLVYGGVLLAQAWSIATLCITVVVAAILLLIGWVSLLPLHTLSKAAQAAET